MTKTHFPPFFLSHGAPMLALDPGVTGAFWHALAEAMPKPDAILCISAHWMTRAPAVGSAAHPETIHDFGGFDDALYRIRYPAPGAPVLAERAGALLRAAGIDCMADPGYGLDHGAWVPLLSLYPDADVPVAQLSVMPMRDARFHARIGAALQPLKDESVLILASGGATHNLRELQWGGGAVPDWDRQFDDWLAVALEAGRSEDLLDWEKTAPNAHRAHPSPEHLLPLFVAIGAAGEGRPATRLHQGFTMGGLSMSAYRFEG